ncbi:iron chelate uptake ABC transporter family permease subunit [Negadavirga shengliensis]|uniref:Iron chelate uptake ABC transporter family permease subunit n=1 Tax=Negadavirga shengliensis TaxID=1389218 RepID=A0ABV9T3G4_9BACT
MEVRKLHTLYFVISILVFLLLWLINLGIGSVSIPIEEIAGRFLGKAFSKSSWEIILMEYRFPKSLTAMLAGTALAVSGLQMQTFFRNPLAGPYVLGISSGAGLGVALLSMAGSAFGWVFWKGNFGGWPITLAASIGAISVLLLMSVTAWRVKDSMTLLILGLMFGSAASAMVAVLAYFSEADELKLYTIWSLGSLGGTGWEQLNVLAISVVAGLLPVIIWIKSYNAMLLGENYAKSMGINLFRLRWAMIISTGILAGSVTAFCGPIAFIGVAVPHIGKMLFRTSNHKVLFPGSALIGAIVLLLCDSVSQLPGSAQTLPINAVTTLIGAPLVIWLILSRNLSKEF